MRKLTEIFQSETIDFKEHVAWIARFRLDFFLFVERVLGYDVQDFHREWIRAIMENDRVAILAPTGYGKTSILGNAYVLWRSYFEQDKQFLIVSNTIPQSTKILEEIRLTIENNEFLADLMPDQAIKTSSWTKTEIRTKTNCKIFCKPYSENIKGFHVNFILCDEAATYVDHDIFFRYVVTRVNAKRGKVAVISTPESITDLMQVLAKKPTYWFKTYKAIQDDGKLLWPNKFTREVLAKIREDIGAAAFEREYLCNPKAMAENCIFPPELVEQAFDYDITFGQRLKEDSNVYLGCDFAIAGGPRSDFDSYVVVERVGEKAIIIHGECHKGLPIHAKIDRIIDLNNRFKITRTLIDPSNVGWAVAEKLREKMIPFDAPDFSSQNRNKMLLQLRQLIESKRLVIPRNDTNPATLTFTNKLVGELLSFVETKTKTNYVTYQSKGAHDDTVMSLVLACKSVSEQREFVDFVAM